MSVVLSVYTNNAFRDYLLPAVNNSNHEVILKAKAFDLLEDVVLKLEIMDGVWNLLGSASYAFENPETEKKQLCDGDIFGIVTGHSENITFMVKETLQSFSVFEKYDLTNVSQLTVGSVEGNDFQYQCATFVSKYHAVIQRVERGFAIRDTSSNGTFINYRKINETQPLRVGDCINIFGLKIVYLGNAIAVSSVDGAFLKVNEKLKTLGHMDANAQVLEQTDDEVFHRAPRYVAPVEEEPIDIEAPPAPKVVVKKPIWMTIGPSFTMVMPMLLGSVIAIMSARSSGSEAGLYMFTGIFTAASSALVGAFWAITNLKYAGKEEAKDEENRQRAYSDYLFKREEQIREKYNHFAMNLYQMYPDAETVTSYGADSVALWNRNRRHRDFLAHRVGLGQIEFPLEINVPKERFSLQNDALAERPAQIKKQYSHLLNVPVTLDLCAERLFGVVGGKDKAGCYSFIKTLLAQITACNCYTDVKLVLIYDKVKDEGNWEYVYWLPHVWSEDKKTRYIASNKTETSEVFYELLQIVRMRSELEDSKKNPLPKPYYIMVVANPELLEGEPIAKYVLGADPACGLTTILLTDSAENLPNECENIIKNEGGVTEIYNVNQEKIQTLTLDQVTDKKIEMFARRILPIRVSETESGGDVPTSMTFFEMHNAGKLSDFNVLENWKKNRTYETMKALIGAKAGGTLCYLDIHEKYHGPHGLVAGTTGSGKSETLQTYMLSLALIFSPDDIGFFIIDFKGGGMAGLFDGLPHLIGSISNLSGNQVKRAMISIKSENRRRQRIFNENNVNNINLYTKLFKNGEVKTPLPHMFIIVDEFAELKREEPEFMKELISVAQVGRSLGVHLILSTQKPSGTVDDNIWSNSKFRLCLRVQDKQDSNDMLHKPDAAFISQTGRGYLQVGNDEVYELFQSGYSGALYDESEEAVKSEVASMITTHGKTSLIGSHQKRVRQNQEQQIWIEKLAACVLEAMQTCNQSPAEFVQNDDKENLVFDCIERNHIAYPRSDYNAKRIDGLVQCVCAVVEKDKNLSIEEIAKNVVVFAQMLGLKLPEEKKKTQLDAIVEYLGEVAANAGYSQQMKLWLPPLADAIYLENITNGAVKTGTYEWKPFEQWSLKSIIGVTDDPENQAQLPLKIDLADAGNIAVIGSVTSGKSTFIQTLVYGLITAYKPSWVNFYALDFSSHVLSCFSDAPHFGGVVYEDDTEKIKKLFFMLDKLIAERKRLFSGGNFAQYVKANGVKLPLIVILIDNLGSFREKTEGKYDDKLTQIIREGIGYGIQFIVSAAGFTSTEINTKMADSFKTVFTLQLNDKFSYCDALRTNQIEVLPENNVKGRGLARVGDTVLEYQTALALEAADDYSRLELISNVCRKMTEEWNGPKARQIPVIPEKPVWTEFEELEDYRQMLTTNRYLPVGYNAESAEVYGIDLSKTFMYLVSGQSSNGKADMQKAIMNSAARMNADIIVIENDGYTLKNQAERLGARYISTLEEQAGFFESYMSILVARNKAKKALEVAGREEFEIFEEMKKEKPIFLFIADISGFIQSLSKKAADVKDATPFIKNVFEKGSLINLYIIVGINPEKIISLGGNELFLAATAYHSGMHFGGMAEKVRYMDFGNFSYNEKNTVRPVGVGMIPTANGEKTREVVVPSVKR